jgi:hypothetical protein
MEILRNTLSAEDEIIESPNWHEEVLSKRKTKIDNGQANFITIDQLKQYYTHWISTSGYDRHGRWKCW